jgi:hypothetical protein
MGKTLRVAVGGRAGARLFEPRMGAILVSNVGPSLGLLSPVARCWWTVSAAGSAFDNPSFAGLPADELFIYEGASEQGRTVRRSDD